MNNVMLDIETLSTRSNAVVTQIGACHFDLTGRVGETFLMNLDIQAQLDKGAVVDGDTLRWWLGEQKDNVTFLDDTQHPEYVLNELNGFLASAEAIWSHATFDFPIVCEAMRRHDIVPLFRYRSARDIRTLAGLAGGGWPKTTTQKTHNALDDCLHQVEYCAEYIKRLYDR